MAGFDTSASLRHLAKDKSLSQYFIKTQSQTTIAMGHFSFWGAGGIPIGGLNPSPALQANQVFGSTRGALSIKTPEALRDLFMYVASVGSQNAGQRGTFHIWDRLLHYGSINRNTTALQTFTNPVTLPRYTTGDGVMAFLEVSANLGAGTSTATFNYKGEDGGAKIATTSMISLPVITRIPHTPIFMNLQAGGKGVLSATSIQFSVASTGTLNLVLVKPLLSIPLLAGGPGFERVLFRESSIMPELFDGHALTFGWTSSASLFASTWNGQIGGVEG